MKVLRNWKRYVLSLIALLIIPLMATACGEDEIKPTIKLADTQFQSLWINNAIAGFVIENGYGYLNSRQTCRAGIWRADPDII